MRQPIPNLQCQHHIPHQLTVAGVIFGEEYLLDLALTSGFYKRSPRKISACSMLAAICSEAAKGSPSCNDLAASIESNHPGQGPSRQAVHLRMGDPLQAFVHRLLEDLIAGSISGATARISNLEDRDRQFGGYKRVLVQDSTIIKLPVHLFEEFSGVSNAHSKVCNARVQATYDLLAQSLIDFSIDPYSKNDQSAAPELPIEAGDLVLRDRGYLLPKEIQRHASCGLLLPCAATTPKILASTRPFYATAVMTVENEETSPKFGNSLLNLTLMPVGAASQTGLKLVPFLSHAKARRTQR